MRSRETEQALRGMLAAAQVSLDQPTGSDAGAAWRAFADLARVPAEDLVTASDSDTDGLLIQYGTYDWGEGEHFELDFTRQFTYYDSDGEYLEMAQLHCTLFFAASERLRALGSDEKWSFGVELEEFLEQAEAMPGLDVVKRPEEGPLRIEVRFEVV